MKTLINKDNPQIRITAPEIEVYEEDQMYLIPVSDYCIPMCIDDWTLVEQKPVEWSEEDLQHKSWILECLAADGERKMPEYAEDFRAAYKWLKSLRPHPHWKPSDEQMAELNKVRTLNPCLDALYQQLKNM